MIMGVMFRKVRPGKSFSRMCITILHKHQKFIHLCKVIVHKKELLNYGYQDIFGDDTAAVIQYWITAAILLSDYFLKKGYAFCLQSAFLYDLIAGSCLIYDNSFLISSSPHPC